MTPPSAKKRGGHLPFVRGGKGTPSLRRRGNGGGQAVILVGHGSKVVGFESAMRRAARALEKRLKGPRVYPAFLEINSPSIDEAIDACAARGVQLIKILPYFLLTGRHVREDIPRIQRAASARHRGHARVVLCPYLGFDSKIVDVLLKRAQAVK